MSLIEYKGKYAAFTLVDSFQILIVLCVVCIGVLLLRLQMRSKEGLDMVKISVWKALSREEWRNAQNDI